MMDVIGMPTDDRDIRQNKGSLPVSDKKLRLGEELIKRLGWISIGPGQDALCCIAISVIDNLIERSERRGLTLAASFGASHHRVTIDVRRNVIRDNTEHAIVAQAARPLAPTRISDSYLGVQIVDNECLNSAEGIALFGGFGPAEGNHLEATVIGNLISGMQGHALRVIGGIGYHGYAARENRVRALISGNRVEQGGGQPILLQGGVSESQEEATDNEVLAQLHGNDLPLIAGRSAIVINDGLLSNTVHLDEPAQPHERVGGVMPFQA